MSSNLEIEIDGEDGENEDLNKKGIKHEEWLDFRYQVSKPQR